LKFIKTFDIKFKYKMKPYFVVHHSSHLMTSIFSDNFR